MVKITSLEQYSRISQLGHIGKVSCSVITTGPSIQQCNSVKGLMYIREFDIDKPEAFEGRLKKSSNVCNIELAFWIKSRNNQTRTVLVTFAQARVPSSVHVPGEGNVKVYPYKQRPSLCANCLQYGHVDKQCKNPVRCSKRGGGHKLAEYEEALSKCMYCEGEYRIGTRECLKQNKKESICEIKHKKKMSWPMARQ